MDPNATLTSIRELNQEILDHPEEIADTESIAEAGAELAELVRSLDEWLVKGGFFPEDWRPF
jgi:hypothetical protein